MILSTLMRFDLGFSAVQAEQRTLKQVLKLPDNSERAKRITRAITSFELSLNVSQVEAKAVHSGGKVQDLFFKVAMKWLDRRDFTEQPVALEVHHTTIKSKQA